LHFVSVWILLGNGIVLTAVDNVRSRSTQPSIHHGTVNEYQLSGNNNNKLCGQPPQYAPAPLLPPWAPKRLAPPSRRQRSSTCRFPCSIRSHAHRCTLRPRWVKRPGDLDLWPFVLESGVRVTCDMGYLCANFSLPRPLCSWLRPDVRDRWTDRQTDRQTDVRQHHRLMLPPIRGGT